MNIQKFKNKHSYQYKSFKREGFSDTDINVWVVFYSKNKEVISDIKIDFNNLISIAELILYTKKLIEIKNIEKFINKNFSNRYRYLINDETYGYIKEIVDLKIDDSVLRSQLFSRIKAFKTKELFALRMKNFLSLIKDFDRSVIIKKVKENNVEIIFDKDDVLIVNIKTYYQSMVLGSLSWCISRGQDHFENYENKEIGGNYFFAWDFNKPPTCPESMVAYNTVPDMNDKMESRIKIVTKFNKNNDSIREIEDKKVDEIVMNNKVTMIEKTRFNEKIEELKNFEIENKNFKKFYRGRNFKPINLIEDFAMFYKLSNLYKKRKKIYKLSLILLIDKIIISRFDKQRNY